MTAWVEVADKLWIGGVGRPFEGEFDYVVAISPLPPASSDRVRHRWVQPTSPQVVVDLGTEVIAARWIAGDRVLVQAIPTVWAELAVAAALVHLGASTDEAISLLRRVIPRPWTDQALREHLEGR